MSDPNATSRPSPSDGVRRFGRPVGLWMLLSALAGAVVGIGFEVVAAGFDLPSPWQRALPSAGSPVAGAPGPGGGPGLPAGSYPPADFRLTSLDGSLVGPRDFLGKPVVVELWATWCGPCRAQKKELEKLQKALGDEVVILAVDQGEDAQTVRSYVGRDPFPYPVLLDPQQSLMQRYGVSGIPTIIVVDARGEVALVHTGVLDADTLRSIVQQSQTTTV
ncbi:MAG: TlpA disulfide reductase family protein [Acidobacteriota bacterium]